MSLLSSLFQTLQERRAIAKFDPHDVAPRGRGEHRIRKWLDVIRKLCVDADYRSMALLRLLRADRLHQTTTLTWSDRYPGIFAACRASLGDAPGLRILSFGCSTGEEVLTLRRYFPSAFIVGAEINRRSLARAAAHDVDADIAFIHSNEKTIKRYGPFDAIFCMAVLQRVPVGIQKRGVTNLEGIYPFEKFDRQVGQLDSWLKPNALLVIHYSPYLLRDTSVGAKYEALELAGQEFDTTPKFGRNSERLQTRAGTTGSIFRKKS